MKYITSTLPYEFECAGQMVPKNKYTSEELARGARLILTVDDEVYDQMVQNKIFLSLVSGNHIIVKDEIPADKAVTTADINRIKEQNAKIIQNTAETIGKLESEKAALSERVGKLEGENINLQTIVQNQETEIERLKLALSEAQKVAAVKSKKTAQAELGSDK